MAFLDSVYNDPNPEGDNIPVGDGDIFDVDKMDRPQRKPPELTLYRVYEGSKIAVGSGTGKFWKRIFDASVKAYEPIWSVWDQVYAYYNNNQSKNLDTPRGLFKRGDGTENVVYSNLNTTLPAIYTKNPTITCSSTDEQDKAFCKSLEATVNALLKRRDKLNAKPKIKKAVGLGLLTNQGVWKIEFTQKDDSRELAQQQMYDLTQKLAKEKDPKIVDQLYGELQALEMNMEVLDPSGINMRGVMPHNLIVDVNAEQPDGLDGNYMIERSFLSTGMLIARYTRSMEGEEENSPIRALVYKPTHKAVFADGQGKRDDGLGMVMREFEQSENPTNDQLDERAAYIDMMFTECFYVWDKLLRRVMLFHRDDWTWPIWVWDDPLKISRFFPYFLVNYDLSTGGTTTVGSTAYYLDQQDEINDINRQINRIRKSIFDFFFYNSEQITSEEAEKFIATLRGDGAGGDTHLLGVKAGENKISDLIQAFLPPSAQYEFYFDTKRPMDAINRITNTSDALRGVQFKTNTTNDAVNTYQEAMRLSVGAKVDVVEDVVADFGEAVAELCVMNYSQQEIAGLIGNKLAEGWRQMGLPEFKATYSLELVAGSMEKPNSVFKKKEAVEIVQAVGQFAGGAPISSLKIMLKVLEQAFTEVVISPEDWAEIDKEAEQKAQSNAPAGNGQPQGPASNDDAMAKMRALPDNVKAQVVDMQKRGVPPAEIKSFLMQQIGGGQAPSAGLPQPSKPPQPNQQGAA